MARFIQSVQRYGPRLAPEPTLEQADLQKQLTLSTGLRRSQVAMVMLEMIDAIQDSLCQGVPVRLEGLGRFRLTTDLQGRLRMHYMPDGALKRQLGKLDQFEGRVINRKNVGLSPEEFKALWDAEFPEDPLEMPRL